jgi:hypothetical protein
MSGALDLRFGASPDCELVECSFVRDHADVFGVLFRMSKGNFLVDACNGTKTRGDQCVGFMEAKHGTVEMRYLTVVGSSAHTHNGALCMRTLDQLLIEHCVFVNTSQVTDEYEAAAVLLCCENAYDSVLADCVFLWSRPNASYTITVLHGGHPLLIERCCFTGPAEREVSPWLIRLVETRFEQEKCPTPATKSLKGTEETVTELPTEEVEEVISVEKEEEVIATEREEEVSHGEKVGGGVKRAAPVMLRFLVPLGIAIVLTVGQALLREKWNDTEKNPKAIL